MSTPLRTGYKQTEVGVIPEDWVVAQIGELEPFVTSGSRGWAAYYSEHGSPFIRITNLSRACIYPDLEDLRYVNVATTDSEAARTQLCDGDVLISITADIGIVGLVTAKLPKPAYINQHIALVRFDAAETDSRFVSYFLAYEKSQKLFRAMTDSGAKAGMNLTTVQQIRIAFPSTKAEQEAIAEALIDADALIESLEQLATKKRHIKQGAMQELLIGKKRLPGFQVKTGHKQTELGVIPQDWEVTTVSHEFSIQLGKMLDSEKNVGVPRPYLGNRAVQWGRIELADIGEVRMTPNDLQRFRLRNGDLLVCEGGEIGRAAIWNQPIQECYFQKALHRLRPIRGYNVSLMLNMLERWASTGFLLNFATQTSIAHLPKDKFENVPLPLPPTKAEQEAIAAILSDMDAEIADLEAQLTKTRSIKQGMMHKLLTGKIRLR